MSRGVRKPPVGSPLIFSEHARATALERSITDREIVSTVYNPSRTTLRSKKGRTIAERGFPAGYVIKVVYDIEPTVEAMERLYPGENVEDVSLAGGQSELAAVLVTVVKVGRRWRERSR